MNCTSKWNNKTLPMNGNADTSKCKRKKGLRNLFVNTSPLILDTPIVSTLPPSGFSFVAGGTVVPTKSGLFQVSSTINFSAPQPVLTNYIAVGISGTGLDLSGGTVTTSDNAIGDALQYQLNGPVNLSFTTITGLTALYSFADLPTNNGWSINVNGVISLPVGEPSLICFDFESADLQGEQFINCNLQVSYYELD